ncbi:MAG: BadF/BadG/BcrA/BcrD ATPase family protein [Planctomycetota bacterium]
MPEDSKSGSTRFLLGVDGGGSKTQAVIAKLETEPHEQLQISDFMELARVSAGPGNLITAPEAKANVNTAVATALHAAREKIDRKFQLDAACLSLAGTGRESILKQWQAWTEENSFASKIRITDDVEPILRHCSRDGLAIAVISGTGSIVVARAADGTRIRCGGWGPLFSDEGSGYKIAMQALRYASLHADQRTSHPKLHAIALRYFGVTEFSEIIPKLQGLSRRELADYAKVVIEHNLQCNDETYEVLHAAAWQLASMIKDAASRLNIGQDPFPLAMAGGILGHSETMRYRLEYEVRRKNKFQQLQPTMQLVDDPVSGAVLLAADSLSSREN